MIALQQSRCPYPASECSILWLLIIRDERIAAIVVQWLQSESLLVLHCWNRLSKNRRIFPAHYQKITAHYQKIAAHLSQNLKNMPVRCSRFAKIYRTKYLHWWEVRYIHTMNKLYYWITCLSPLSAHCQNIVDIS